MQLCTTVALGRLKPDAAVRVVREAVRYDAPPVCGETNDVITNYWMSENGERRVANRIS